MDVMGWLYLLGAFIFPVIFILWRPRRPVPPANMRLRFAGSVVVVWLLMILWSTQGSIADGGADVDVERTATTQETTVRWQADAPTDAPLIVLLGWVPGLVYAGLLSLARKGLESPAAEVFEGRIESEDMLRR